MEPFFRKQLPSLTIFAFGESRIIDIRDGLKYTFDILEIDFECASLSEYIREAKLLTRNCI